MLRSTLLLVTASLLAATSGCQGISVRDLDDGGSCATVDLHVPPQDLATPAPKCAAAKGLAGDNLLCVDFDKVTQLTDPALAGWNFNANTANCWQISGGYLQVQNFGTFMGNCGLTLPPIDYKVAPNTNYQRATLAFVHKVDMTDPDQQAQIYIGLDSPARLIHQTTSRPGLPTLTTTTLTVNKADLPMTVMNIYTFFLKSTSLTMSGRPGWQIQSIAINATL